MNSTLLNVCPTAAAFGGSVHHALAAVAELRQAGHSGRIVVSLCEGTHPVREMREPPHSWAVGVGVS